MRNGIYANLVNVSKNCVFVTFCSAKQNEAKIIYRATTYLPVRKTSYIFLFLFSSFHSRILSLNIIIPFVMLLFYIHPLIIQRYDSEVWIRSTISGNKYLSRLCGPQKACVEYETGLLCKKANVCQPLLEKTSLSTCEEEFFTGSTANAFFSLTWYGGRYGIGKWEGVHSLWFYDWLIFCHTTLLHSYY